MGERDGTRTLERYRNFPKREFGSAGGRGKAGGVSVPAGGDDRWGQDSRLRSLVSERSRICDGCDNSGCALKNCRPCRRRALLSNPGMACPSDPPKWGPAPAAREGGAVEQETGEQKEALRVVWTIPAYNEPLLGSTVESLYRSAEGANLDFAVLVVDDASTDGSTRGLGCAVVTNTSPKGVGRNLNLAARLALEMGADVVGVADAHMKVPRGAVEALARKAAGEVCVVSSAAFGWEETSAMRQWGAYLVRSRRDCLAAKWMGGKWPRWGEPPRRSPRGEWARVQVPLGAFYAMGRAAVERLSAPTGRLWENVAGRWGFLLEPLAVKCCFLGVPVYVSRDHYTRHFYRRRNPLRNAHVEKVRNVAFATAGVFSEETWRRHFRPWCVTRAGVEAGEVDRLAAKACEGARRPWGVEDEEEVVMSIPDLEDEKECPIPIEKIVLAPPRDKMVRSARVRRKGASTTDGREAVLAVEEEDGRS